MRFLYLLLGGLGGVLGEGLRERGVFLLGVREREREERKGCRGICLGTGRVLLENEEEGERGGRV